jgi:hypothetical protein
MQSFFSFDGLKSELLLRLAGFFQPEPAQQNGARPSDTSRSDSPQKAALPPDSASVSSRLPGAAYLEILLLAALLPSALLWFSGPASLPLVLAALVLSPLLLGLHYGFVAGTSAAALTAGVLAGLVHFKPELLAEFPKAQVIALLLVGMCAGQARNRWAAQVRRLSSLSHYHQKRLRQFTGEYQALQVSHAQLERRLGGGSGSLRTALQRLKLREPVLVSARGEPLGGIAPWLLDIMVETGHLHTAAVYAINERGGLHPPAVASVGRGSGLSLFNPLLRETLRTGMLTSVQAGHEAVHEHVIAVVPLVDAGGHIHGVVSISDMPFMSVHQETFELLGLLGRHIGDILAHRTRPLSDGRDTWGLRQSLERTLTDARRHGLPGALVACKVIDAAEGEACVAQLCHSSRGLDQNWVATNRKGQPVVLTLLPLTDEAGVKSYLARQQDRDAGGARTRATAIHLWMLDKTRQADDILAEVAVICNIEALDGFGSAPQQQAAGAAKVAL